MEVEYGSDLLGVFALSSAIGAHVLVTRHHGVEKSWWEDRFFWMGLFGNLPALVAVSVHLVLERWGERGEAEERAGP